MAQAENFMTPDSLKSLDYDQLYDTYLKIWPDTLTSKVYLNTFLKKAITENNTIKIADAYGLLSYYAKEEPEKIRLLNRSIELSKDVDHNITIRGYSFKGGFYMNKGKYALALDSYLKLLALAEKVQNTKFIYITKHNIACIKTEIGKHEEALPLFKEYFTYVKGRRPTDTLRYLKSIIPLAESYRYNNDPDTSSVYHLKAIKRAQKPGYFYNRFYGKILINEGINLFFREQYEKAFDSIVKGFTLMDKSHSENRKAYILGEFYLGKLALLRQDVLSAKKHFVTVDALLQKETITPYEVRESYEFMIHFFKANEEKEQQLEYINKLLKFDSIINSEVAFVSTRLFKEFDTPILLEEKETLINELKGSNKNLNFLVVFLLTLTIVTVTFLYRQYRKRKTYQLQFEKLIHKNSPGEALQNKPLGEIGVADDIVADILNNLTAFETNQQFLQKNISIAWVAKEIGTNTKYLSKVINHHKGKNFANYINDLRIAYAVKALKENEALKHLTIQGIAEEMGFNTAESFSSAFKKSTGIKTSYFIRKLLTLDTS